MKKLSFFLCLFLAFTACKTGNNSNYQARISSEEGTIPSVRQFMSDALYNGLMRHQFPKEIAKALLGEEKLFVGKCPICTPTRSGISAYINEDGMIKAIDKIDANMLQRLQGENITEKQEAFRDLVSLYTRWQESALGLNASQLKELRNNLAKDRKTGMSRKSENFGKFCPSCDGACEVKD